MSQISTDSDGQAEAPRPIKPEPPSDALTASRDDFRFWTRGVVTALIVGNGATLPVIMPLAVNALSQQNLPLNWYAALINYFVVGLASAFLAMLFLGMRAGLAMQSAVDHDRGDKKLAHRRKAFRELAVISGFSLIALSAGSWVWGVRNCNIALQIIAQCAQQAQGLPFPKAWCPRRTVAPR